MCEPPRDYNHGFGFSPPFWAYGSGGVLFIYFACVCVEVRIICSRSLFSPTLLVLEVEFTLIKAWQQALSPVSQDAGPVFCF